MRGALDYFPSTLMIKTHGKTKVELGQWFKGLNGAF